jgi:hypothetical protein
MMNIVFLVPRNPDGNPLWMYPSILAVDRQTNMDAEFQSTLGHGQIDVLVESGYCRKLSAA